MHGNRLLTRYSGEVVRSIVFLASVALWVPGLRASGSVQTCATCHRDLWETYSKTGMARSFSTPAPQNMVEDFTRNNTYYHQASNSYFTMLRRGNAYYQRRYQLDAAGKQINVMEKRVDYIMGSGNHSRAYVSRTSSGTLVELPLAWYSEKNGYWAMNPGYDRPDHEGFRRLITYDCMFCHNAYPKIPAGHEQPWAEPVYERTLPSGISCERCHGSGERHMQLAATAGAKREEIRGAIVNPARLSPERQMEVCMACHLETTSFALPNAIQRYERGPFSFRPGEALSGFILNFDHAPGTGREDKFQIVNAVYRLRQSACFRNSEGRLTCTTCHNPHDIPRGERAVAHYNQVCRQCHSTAFDRQVALGSHTKEQDCIGCHMPKRRTEDVVHVVMTDHYIQRRRPQGDLLAELPERHEVGDLAYRGPVVLYYPEVLPKTAENELYLADAQVKQGSNRKAGIEQLTSAIRRYSPQRAEWYLDLAEALDADGRLKESIPFYREAVRRSPESAVLRQRLGTALRRSGEVTESLAMLQSASAADPQRAVTWHEIGLTFRSLGKMQEAVEALRTALGHDPEFPEARNNLGAMLLSAANLKGAETEFREAIRIRPDYADAHANLASLLMKEEKLTEAGAEFALAVQLKPGDPATHYSYAMLLGRRADYDGARHQLEAALRADPNFVDAHQLLGDLAMGQNRAADAIPHYRAVLAAHPDSGPAELGLGAALLGAGNVNEAILHLQAAAAGPDAATRERAADLLRQLKR